MALLVLVDLVQELCIFFAEAGALLQAAEGRCEDECDVAVPYDMRGDGPRAGFETSVCDPFKAHPCYVERGGLLCVADIPVDMVIAAVC